MSYHGRSSTTQELNSLVKVLELYTLHVLLRNNEWESSREVITVSSILDEERREAFLKALQTLQDEQELIQQRQKEEQRYTEEKMKRDAEEAKRLRESEQTRYEEERSRRNKRDENNELVNNFGARLRTGIVSPASAQSKPCMSKKASHNSAHPPTKASVSSIKPSFSFIYRARLVIGNIYRLIQTSSRNHSMRPLSILEFLMLIMGLFTMLRQRNVRNMIESSWFKIRQTAAMAGKVSYV